MVSRCFPHSALMVNRVEFELTIPALQNCSPINFTTNLAKLNPPFNTRIWFCHIENVRSKNLISIRKRCEKLKRVESYCTDKALKVNEHWQHCLYSSRKYWESLIIKREIPVDRKQRFMSKATEYSKE